MAAKKILKFDNFCSRTLLELGASPNYKDMKGLTPLYMCVMHASDVVICEMLLHDHAIVGAQDLQGWQEVHQVHHKIVRKSYLWLLRWYLEQIIGFKWIFRYFPP